MQRLLSPIVIYLLLIVLSLGVLIQGIVLMNRIRTLEETLLLVVQAIDLMNRIQDLEGAQQECPRVFQEQPGDFSL